MKKLMQMVERVARSSASVLITGETGSGKEFIARALHHHSLRCAKPWIDLNCAALPEHLVESELFGYEKGAFSGADALKQGLFELANGGTLFLDEIGELPADAQVRLLRVLQDGFVERVGGSQLIHVDVRVVAATHRDLQGMVRENRFREDLWYRIAVFPVLLPPLRERKEDIPAMAEHFAERAAIRFGLAPVKPTAEEMRLLEQYDWPGNVRELGAVIDRAAILGDGKLLEVAAALGLSRVEPSPMNSGTPDNSLLPTGFFPRPSVVLPLADAMRQHITSALRVAQGRIEGPRGAAAMLKINPHTLRARMRKLHIDWGSFRPNEGDQRTNASRS
jgi:hydrogenase-4 transcriptional activator